MTRKQYSRLTRRHYKNGREMESRLTTIKKLLGAFLFGATLGLPFLIAGWL